MGNELDEFWASVAGAPGNQLNAKQAAHPKRRAHVAIEV